MKERSIRDRVKAALTDPSTTDEQRKLVESALRENLAKCTKETGRNYYLFLVFAAVFTMLAATDVGKIAFGGVEFSRKNPAVLLIPVLASFCFYRAICLFLYQDLLSTATQAFYQDALKPFENNDITDLFAYPVFTEIENTFVNILEMPLESMSNAWIVGVGLVCLLGPLVWFGFASLWIVKLFGSVNLLTIAVLVLIWMFLLRAIGMLVQTRKY